MGPPLQKILNNFENNIRDTMIAGQSLEKAPWVGDQPEIIRLLAVLLSTGKLLYNKNNLTWGELIFYDSLSRGHKRYAILLAPELFF